MSLGKLEITNKHTGIFSFINKIWEEEKHEFVISKTEELSEWEKEAFSKFWGAKSPYTEGKITNTLEITDSVIKHSEKVKWYTETILLHELSDHDDNENSMIEAEKYVINKIQKSEYSKEEKMNLIKSHLWFFECNKSFYEGLFTTYKERYEQNEKEYEKTKSHYKKICAVVEYLIEIID